MCFIWKILEENEEKPHHQRNCKNGRCILPETTCPTDQGTPCHFPFTFQGIEYGKCTNAGHEKPWCSIGVHVPHGMVCDECWKNETYTWGHCIPGGNDENCIPQSPILTTTTVWPNLTTSFSTPPTTGISNFFLGNDGY